jgi:hypothetical protein
MHIGKTIIKDSTYYTIFNKGVKVYDSLFVGKNIFVNGNLKMHGYFYVDSAEMVKIYTATKIFSIENTNDAGSIHLRLGHKVNSINPNFSIAMLTGPISDIALFSIDSVNGAYVNYGGFDVRNGGTYKTNGTPGYITSVFGALTESGIYGSTSGGVFMGQQLYYVALTINGVTRWVLCADTGGGE